MDYSHRSPQGENMLRTIYFDHPRWTPAVAHFLPACWMKYGAALDDLIASHPRLFPSFEKPAVRRPPILPGLYAAGYQQDCWGCGWQNMEPGMIGQVVGHPLADWDAFETWQPPDPQLRWHLSASDWNGLANTIREKRQRGDFHYDNVLQHGFHFLLLCDLRGFQNAMLDMITDDPRLHRLIEIIMNYNAVVIARMIELGSEYICLAEDLGHQHRMPISLELFRKFAKPGYEATAGQARDRGIPVYLHSDGHILPVIDDLIETGIRVINPQVRANGLPGLREQVRGKMAIDIDLDRQLFPFVGKQQLIDHIHEVYEALWMPEGGLLLKIEIGPDVSLESMDTIFTTAEQICRLPEPGAGNRDFVKYYVD